MKIINLNGNVEDFVKAIAIETEKGSNVVMRIPGSNTSFKAVVYAWTSLPEVRSAVISKLRVVKSYEQNLKLLEEQLPTAEFLRYLDNSTPDDIAELCFEQGYVNSSTCQARSL